MSAGITIITFCKISIKGSDDSVFPVGVIYMSCPLTNTGTTGIRQYHTTHFFKCIDEAISFNRKANQFAARSDSKFSISF